jgi:F420-non-reducing hydrogenase iron-sulfur subunit
LEHIGIEPDRLQFSWISSSEGSKFAETATEITGKVKEIGPAGKLIKGRAEVV